MIVNDLNIFSATRRPTEANPELVVDANAVLAVTVSAQCFQAIAWGHTKIIQAISLIQLLQFSPCDRLDVDESPNPVSIEQRLGVRTIERLDHT
jgi:hypothetical protein